MEQNNTEQKWTDKLKESYRLSIIEKDSYKEIRSFDLSLLNLYIYAVLIFCLLGILISCLFLFTPVKKMIPGYGDVYQNEEFILVQKQIDQLEDQIASQATYIEGLKNMLNGVDNTSLKAMTSLPKNATNLGIDEHTESDDEIKYIKGSQYFINPIEGNVSDEFLPEKAHYGIDLIAPINSPVKAVLDGIIVQAGFDNAFGNTITIQHANNILTVYKHNAKLLKKIGDKVKKGDAIAIIGNTGTESSGAHLHFEIWQDGRAINPRLYLRLG